MMCIEEFEVHKDRFVQGVKCMAFTHMTLQHAFKQAARRPSICYSVGLALLAP